VCFSPEADLIGGVVVGGIGVDAVRHVLHRRELAIALLPVVFGAHQLIEAFAWWGLDGKVPLALGDAAAWVYLLIAFALPVVVPLAILSIEPEPAKRRQVLPFVGLGAVVSVILLAHLVSGPVTVQVADRTLAYDVHLSYGGQLTALYVIATCVPLLLSRNPRIRVFGILNLAAVIVLAWLMATRVISLWCAWAAVTSIVIVIHLRTDERRDHSKAAVTDRV
jgi:hypothetical protein